MISQGSISRRAISVIFRVDVSFIYALCRTVVIPYESRTVVIPYESRTVVIPYESRTVVIPYEDKTVNPQC